MTNNGGPRLSWVHGVVFLVLLALGAASCSGDDDDVGSDASTAPSAALDEEGEATFAPGQSDAVAEEPAEEAFDTAEEAEVEERRVDDGGGESVQDGDAPLPDIGRSIIFVAHVEVQVDDVLLSTRQAKTAIAGLGGLVFGESTTVGKFTTTTLEFKVFPEDFQEALNRLEGLGELQSQQISADDVTERVVDLESRISTAEISVDRLRGFLEGATDLEDIAELESQLLERETDLERLRGQLRTIQDHVSLATIFLTLSETTPPPIEALGEFDVTFYQGDDDGARCPGARDLSVDEGEQFTVCVEITNVGTNAIGDIEVRDHGLDLDPRDFTFIDDADDEPLEPGQTIFAFASADAPAQGASVMQVNADVLDDSGEQLRIGVDFFGPEDSTIRFIEDDSLPGFVDALKASWDTLVLLAGVALLAIGAVVPFLWVPIVVWVVYRWWAARGQKKAAARQAARSNQPEESSSPAPPVPPPAPVHAADTSAGADADQGSAETD
jgi:hypothetical protein